MIRTQTLSSHRRVAGNRVSLRAQLADLLSRAFGCHHRDMSRPFTLQGESFKSCLTCGARRRFDPRTYKMRGPFYFNNPSQK
jgi:hypothetical protein